MIHFAKADCNFENKRRDEITAPFHLKDFALGNAQLSYAAFAVSCPFFHFRFGAFTTIPFFIAAAETRT